MVTAWRREYDRRDVMDHAARRAGDLPVNPIVMEAGLLILTAVSFWLLDRYVIGCENV